MPGNQSKTDNPDPFWRILVMTFTVIIVCVIVFYFVVWRVPDRSKEVNEKLKEYREYKEKCLSIPPDKSGVKYLKKATEKLDFSDYEELFLGLNRFNPYLGPEIELQNKFLELLKVGETKKVMTITSMSIKKNQKFFNLIDKGLKLNNMNLFNIEEYTLIIISQPDPFLLLIFTGKYYRYEKKLRKAVKRYVQVFNIISKVYVHSKNLSFDYFFYWNVCVTQLRKLIDNNQNNPELLKYIIKTINEIQDEFRFVKFTFCMKYDNLFQERKLYRKKCLTPTGKLGFLKCFFYRSINDRDWNIVENDFLEFMKCIQKPVPQSFAYISKIRAYRLRYQYEDFLSTLKFRYREIIKLQSDLDNIRILSALHLYKLEEKEYPDSLKQRYLKRLTYVKFSPGSGFKYRREPYGSFQLIEPGF